MHRAHFRHQAVTSAAAVALICFLSGCGEGPIAQPTDGGSEQPPQSVGRKSAPGFYSNDLTSKLNNLRQQTYSTQVNVPHSDVLYTAAYRHAKNLNTTNMAGVSTRPLPGQSGGIPTTTITAASDLDVLLSETPPAGTDQYPLFFTSVDPYNRVRAVVGGDDLLFSGGTGRGVFELYDFNGNVPQPSGQNSDFRGYNLDLRLNAIQAISNDNNFRYDPVDSMWYSRRGRHALTQPTLRAWSYASVQDDDVGNSIVAPILSGRFLGVGLGVCDRPLTQQLGYWPNPGNTDVTPYGTDTDLQTDLTEPGGDSPFHGVPIHITMPAAEPFLRISLSFSNVTPASTANPLGGYPTNWPKRWRKLAIFSNQDVNYMRNSVLTLNLPDVTSAPGYAPAELIGIVKLVTTGSEVTDLRDGELMFQTLGPLPPLSTFRVDANIRSAQGRALNLSWTFTTNANSSFAP
jgi:hypothetical protein